MVVGQGKVGVDELPDLDLDVTFFGYGDGILDGLWQVGEQPLHFRRRLHVQALGVTHSLVVGDHLAGLDADEGVVGGVVVCVQEVKVVSGHEGHVEPLVKSQQAVVDARNVLDRSEWMRAGFDHQGIGR